MCEEGTSHRRATLLRTPRCKCICVAVVIVAGGWGEWAGTRKRRNKLKARVCVAGASPCTLLVQGVARVRCHRREPCWPERRAKRKEVGGSLNSEPHGRGPLYTHILYRMCSLKNLFSTWTHDRRPAACRRAGQSQTPRGFRPCLVNPFTWTLPPSGPQRWERHPPPPARASP